MEKLIVLRCYSGAAFFVWVCATIVAPAYAKACANTVFSGEFETGYQLQWHTKSEENWQRLKDSPKSTMTLALESCLSAETGLIAEFSLETGADSDADFDAIFIETVINQTDLRIGKIESVTYSSDSGFSSSAAIEFSEVGGTGLSLTRGIGSTGSASRYGLFLIQDNHDAPHSKNQEYPYGFSVSFKPTNGDLTLLAGAISDLWADDPDVSTSSVPLWFVQMLLQNRKWFFLLEHGAVTTSFKNAEPETERPSATLLEIGREFSEKSIVSLRMENTRQLPEEPEQRLGLSFQYQASQHLDFAVEYLHSFFSHRQESLYQKKQESLVLFVGRVTF